MKKPRGDAKLKTLPADLQALLFAMLRQKTAVVVKAWLAKEHQVQTSTGALSHFYAWYPLSRRLEQAADFADQLKQQLAKLPEIALDAQKLSTVAQVAFEARALQEEDADLYVALKKRRQKDAELAITESRHSLALRQYEEKIAAAKAGLEKARSKGGLSKETLALIEDQLRLL